MTAMISHIFLQDYWWIIISLLAGLLVFLMFVQGGQTFIFSLPSDSLQKKMVVNATGRKWEFTFTTLVTFGGAFFAAFPLFYATSFGGAYWVWIAILFSFIIQAISYEYRSKPANIYGEKTFDVFLLVNGYLGPFLIGVAVGTFFTGARFSLNEMNQVRWETPWRGLEALADVRNLALGFSVLFLTRVNGLLYLVNTLDDDELASRAGKKLITNSALFLSFFVFFLVSLLLSSGYTTNENSGTVVTEKFRYLQSFLQMPAVLAIFLAGVAAVICGIFISLFKISGKGIWFTGSGTVLAVFALFLVAGFNGTPFYPSSFDPRYSLTLRNASSSYFTLKTMMYVSFLIPFIVAYIWHAWRSINRQKITGGEMKTEGHTY
jgi:cytochrome d ubiquinol oxidase subunit II